MAPPPPILNKWYGRERPIRYFEIRSPFLVGDHVIGNRRNLPQSCFNPLEGRDDAIS